VSQRGRSGILLLAAAAFLSWRLWEFLVASALVLTWPFELDYGEGIVWQQANMLLGPDAFGPVDGFPAIVFHYTPVFHFLTLGLSSVTGLDMLFSGRLVSIGSTLLSAVMIGVIACRAMPVTGSGRVRVLAAIGGAMTIFCMWPVTYWAMLMRVDMPGFLFSLVGFWLGLKAFEQPRLIYLSGLAFVLAVYTKQTLIVAPAATFLLMLWLRPKLAMKGIATCLVLGGGALLIANWLTDGGFLRHIFLYNINRFDPKGLYIAWAVLKAHIVLILVAGFLIRDRWAELRARYAGKISLSLAENKVDLAFVSLLLYFGLATLMLASIAKSGSNANYTLEWLFILASFVGIAVFEAVNLAVRNVQSQNKGILLVIAVIGVPAAMVAQAWSLKSLDFAALANPERGEQLQALSERIRSSNKPVIADEMVLVIRSGKDVVWEPAIFAELASTGVWDEKPLVRKILAQDFAMFVTVGRRGMKLFDSRYNPAIAEAMDRAYPVKEKVAGYTVHLPRQLLQSVKTDRRPKQQQGQE
jgi:hypothetical protein